MTLDLNAMIVGEVQVRLLCYKMYIFFIDFIDSFIFWQLELHKTNAFAAARGATGSNCFAATRACYHSHFSPKVMLALLRLFSHFYGIFF